MKLLTKSTIYFIVTSIAVFLVSGVTIYYLLQDLIREEIDDSLLDRKSEFYWELREAGGFDTIVLPKDSTIHIAGPVAISGKDLITFGDTLFYDFFDDERLPHRYIRFTASYNGEKRYVYIYQSLIETDDIVEGIIFSLLIVFIIMIAAISALNIFGMRHVWRPFNKILQQIKVFDFRKNRGFEAINADISEFNELNAELTKMTDKLTRDYFSLKEFSENASHEMQTPLAIIQSKLELLLQKQDIGDENLNAVNSALQAANRLSRLHHELNLITRIENQEYKDFEEIDIKAYVKKYIENFSDILDLKNIELKTSLHSGFKIKGNVYLIEILISNLFNNAVKHNLEQKGTIIIELDNGMLKIANTGPEPQHLPEALFERFKKGKPQSDSTGLGLSLVKQICTFHNFEIRYTFHDKQHILIVTF